MVKASTSDGFLTLLTQLTNHLSSGHVGSVDIKDNEKIHLKYKRIAFEIIFNFRKDLEKEDNRLTEFEELLWYSHLLHRRRRYDDVKTLLKNLNKFKKKDLLNKNSDCSSILRFLWTLRENANENCNSLSQISTWILPNEKDRDHLPHGPLNYNDTRFCSTSYRKYYTHFPSDLFDVKESCFNSTKVDFSNCDEEPGIGHNFKYLKIEEGKVLGKCLNALICNRNKLSPDTLLQIPELPSRPNNYSLSQNFLSKHCLETNVNKITSKHVKYLMSSCENEPQEDDVWEFVSKNSIDRLSPNWEYFGDIYVKKEKPFVSETPFDVTEQLYFLHLNLWSCHFPNKYDIPYFKRKSSMFSRDILYLLVGISSVSFSWDETKKTFQAIEGLCFPGVAPDSLLPHLSPFIECGNRMKRLEEICNKKGQSSMKIGLVYQGFITALQNFLSAYRKNVFSLSEDSGFQALRLKTDCLQKKLNFIAHICCEIEAENLRGLPLIAKFLKYLTETNEPSHIYLILSFLSTIVKPFIRFIEKWIYTGEFSDPFFEYMILVNSEFLSINDRCYWTDGHTVNVDILEALPHFISNILQRTFQCGKGLNLLKSISPKNYVISDGSRKHPLIVPCFSNEDLKETKTNCQDYYLEMVNSAQFSQITLSQLDDIESKKKASLLHSASRRLKLNLQRINDKKIREKQEEYERKKILLENQLKEIETAKLIRMIKIDSEKNILNWETESDIKEKIQKGLKENLESVYGEKLRIAEETKEKLLAEIAHLTDQLSSFESFEDTANALHANSIDVSPIIGNRNSIQDFSESTDYTADENSSCMSTTSDLLTPLEEKLPDNHFDNPMKEILEKDIPSDFNDNPLTDTEIRTDNLQKGRVLLEEFGIDTLNSNPKIQNGNVIRADIKTNLDKDIISDVANANIVSHSDLHTNCLDNLNTKYASSPGDKLKEIIEINSVTNSGMDLEEDDRKTEIVSGLVFSDGESVHSDRDKNDSELSCKSSENLLISGNSVDVKMRKSRSATFTDSSVQKMKNRKRAFHSCLFSAEDDFEPVLIDKGTNNINADKVGEEKYFGTELLASRNLNLQTIFIPYQGSNLQLCGNDPLSSIGETICKSVFSKSNLHQSIPSLSVLSFIPNFFVRSLSMHVDTQTKLVNEALLSHFLIKERLLDQFSAIKSFILLHDSSFAHALSNIFEKWEEIRDPFYRLNSVKLRSVLHEVIASFSIATDSVFADNLSFVVFNIPSQLDSCLNPFDFITLHYKVEWPLNIIIDENILKDYEKLGNFFTLIHYSMWAMVDVFKKLSFTAKKLQKETGSFSSPQFHQISMFRHEMHQFIHIVFGYVRHEGIESCWSKFQKDLRTNVTTLDDLYQVHSHYIQRILSRCFLIPNAEVIHNVFKELLMKAFSFRRMIISHLWKLNPSTKYFEHYAFDAIKKLLEEFRTLSLFLNKLLKKLFQYTQLDYIDALVMQLNFSTNEEFV